MNTVMQHESTWVIGEQELGPFEQYFSRALERSGCSVKYHNIHDLYPDYWRKAGNYFHRLPRKLDNSLREKYVSVLNQNLRKAFGQEKPSLIFIYNDCLITPETISYFKKKDAKVVTFLGDDPGYLLPGKKTFLLTVLASDAVIVPDTGWIPGLKMLEAGKIIFSPIGTDPNVFFPTDVSGNERALFSSDIIFVGTGYYLNSWGIKRAEILSVLSDLDFKLFGDKQWLEVLKYYPQLQKNFVNRRLNAREVNTACNCAKIYPVTVNSGVVNGVSTRIFDGLASGIFVIAEYKSDLDLLFDKSEVASFTTKSELKRKTEYYLANENERSEMASKARERVLREYTLDTLVPKILDQL
jgi:spore maturation protein CgeB